MKYFRHFSDASSSLTIQKILDEMGLEGYAQYFLLLELLNSKFDGSCTKIAVHSDEISSKVRIKFSKKLETFVQKLANFSVLSYQLSGKVYEIDCPILFELMDKDSKYNRKKIATDSHGAKPRIEIKNKIKEVEEEKEINKENEFYPVPFENNLEPEVNFQKLVDLYNQTIGKLRNEYSSLTWCPQNLIQELRQTLQVSEFQKLSFWEKYFERAKGSDFLNGKSKLGFKANLLWLIKLENAYKVLNGQYDNGTQQNNSGISDELKAQMDQRAREYDEAVARGEAV